MGPAFAETLEEISNPVKGRNAQKTEALAHDNSSGLTKQQSGSFLLAAYYLRVAQRSNVPSCNQCVP